MGLVDYVRGVVHPEAWHGTDQPAPYFEGWYFKVVDARASHPLAFIPGIHLSSDPAASHAFVQVVDGATGRGHYLRYPVAEFSAAPDRLAIRVGRSRFEAEGLHLDLQGDGFSARGRLDFGPLAPWPVRPTAPGAMGWYGFVPRMECYHGVPSLDHALGGRLTVHGLERSFDGGRGYVEKDWGRNFPAEWVWLQSNAFAEAPGTSVTASLARVPWRGDAFPGLLVGVWHGGRLWRFTSYTGARVERLEVTEERVRLEVARQRQRLELIADRGQAAPIRGPTPSGMDRVVHEALGGRLWVRLAEGGRVRFEGTGLGAGVEVQGEVDRLHPGADRRRV